MAIDAELREKVRTHLKGTRGIAEKPMVGGTGFTWRGNLLCGVIFRADSAASMSGGGRDRPSSAPRRRPAAHCATWRPSRWRKRFPTVTFALCMGNPMTSSRWHLPPHRRADRSAALSVRSKGRRSPAGAPQGNGLSAQASRRALSRPRIAPGSTGGSSTTVKPASTAPPSPR